MDTRTKYRVLRALHLNGSLTAKALSALCDIPSATCLRAARQLCAMGLVKESVSTLKNNRKQIKFSSVKNELRALGIHILQNKVVMSVVSSDGNVCDTLSLERDADYSELSNINEIAEHAERLISENGYLIKAIGITRPGPVMLHNGLIRRVQSFGGINAELLADELRLAFEVPVTCSFDSECAGEYYLLKNREAVNGVTCVVVAGDTVTAAIFNDGKLLRSNGLAGLIGHTGLNFRDERCYCGNRGCLENYVSTSLLIDSLQTSTLFGVNLLTFDEAVELYKSGDPSTVKSVDNLAANLAIGLVNMIWTLNPSNIIVTGDLTRFGGVLSGPINSVIKQRVLPEAFAALTISVSDNVTDEFAAGSGISAFGEGLETKFKISK